MKNRLIGCFLILLPLFVFAQQYDPYLERDIFQLINTQKDFELFQEYKKHSQSLSHYGKLFIEAVLCMQFNREREAIKLIDSIQDNYPDRLTTSQLLSLNANKVYHLFNLGLYAETYNHSLQIIEKYKESMSESNLAFFNTFKNRGEKLYNIPPAGVKLPDKDCYVPIKPYKNSGSHDFISAPVKINDVLIEDCIFDTGAAISFFSEEEALKAKIKIIDDTLVTSKGNYGKIKYRPGIIDSIVLGEAVLTNVYAGIICSGYTLPNVFGLKDMRKFGKMVFTSDKIIFSNNVEQNSTVIPNMSVRGKAIFFRCKTGQKNVDFLFDSGCLGTNINNSFFPPDTLHPDWNNLTLVLGDSSYTFHNVRQVKGGNNFAGLIGTIFIRSFEKVTLDFVNMQINTDSFIGHTYRDAYLIRRDFFNLDELEKEHEFNGYRKYLLKVLNYSGKNRPAEIISYIDTLLVDYYIDAYPHLYSFLQMKEEALIELGEYTEAKDLLRKMAENSESPEYFKASLRLTDALAVYPATKISFTTQSGKINISKKHNEIAIPVDINNKNGKAIINLGIQPNLFSEEMASKFNIKILADSIPYNYQKVKVGIIDELTFGNVIAENIICYILPEGGNYVTLGRSLLKSIPQISVVSGKEITFYEKRKQQVMADSLPMRLHNSLLMTQLQFNGEWVTFAINNENKIILNKYIKDGDILYFGKYKIPFSDIHSHKVDSRYLSIQGEIGFQTLLENDVQLVFDFEQMKIYVEK